MSKYINKDIFQNNQCADVYTLTNYVNSVSSIQAILNIKKITNLPSKLLYSGIAILVIIPSTLPSLIHLHILNISKKTYCCTWTVPVA